MSVLFFYEQNMQDEGGGETPTGQSPRPSRTRWGSRLPWVTHLFLLFWL